MATQDTHPDKLESDLDIRREVHAKFATIDATSVGKSKTPMHTMLYY